MQEQVMMPEECKKNIFKNELVQLH